MAERAQIVVKGIVQGVGFRPFVYNLARALGLKGYVTNTSEGVLIDVEGGDVSLFIDRLRSEAPPLSRISEILPVKLPTLGYQDFTIRKSIDGAAELPFTLVSPDVSICDDCLRELTDPTDRRYLYPFINCTNCGPRYSITRKVPYDRPNTTMAGFTQCSACSSEYSDPGNRRFHAQPNACAACGPTVEYKVQSSEYRVEDKKNPVQKAIKVLKRGGIVAVKGIGGFHIACDAANDGVVKRLREKKRKSNKPFAVMSPSVTNIEEFCFMSEAERNLLQSIRRPIVLLRKKKGNGLSDAVSPNNQYLGCMLPYTPLHYLLFRHPLDSTTPGNTPHFQALIMTSGNLAEEPIVRDNDEALRKLSAFVDGFLLHDRDIFMRVDDSVVRVQSSEFNVQRETHPHPSPLLEGEGRKQTVDNPGFSVSSTLNSRLRTPDSELSFIRRSRGYAPDPIALHDEGPEVLGCGADLKNTFTLTKGNFAIPSQHIGDMENYETVKFYEECLGNLKAVYRVQPKAIAHDLHPGYLSTRWAIEEGAKRPELQLFAIQHHYAHIGSVMAEHGLTAKVIGVAFDGTGYGTDGNLWGGEFFVADIDGFVRQGQFRYIALPGGEAAIKEPWKIAVSLLMSAAGEGAERLLERSGFDERYGKDNIRQIMTIARASEFSPLSSGAGRLFDAVSALLGVCDRNTFEGEAAMALEALTQEGIEDEYPVSITFNEGYGVVDFSPVFLEIVDDLVRNSPKAVIATKFHNTVASVVLSLVGNMSEKTGIRTVALSGGTFQNRYLLNRLLPALSSRGFVAVTNLHVPCNDACISLGQAYLVRERLKKENQLR